MNAASPPGTGLCRPPVPIQLFSSDRPPMTSAVSAATRVTAGTASRMRWAAVPGGEPRGNRDENRQRGEYAECEQRDDGRRGAKGGVPVGGEQGHGGPWLLPPGGPYPADEQLRPLGGAHDEEHRARRAECAEARGHVPATGRGRVAWVHGGGGTGQAGTGEPGEQPALGDVEGAAKRAWPFGDVADEQFGELLAVPVPPWARVPEQQLGCPQPGGCLGIGIRGPP